MKLRAIRLHNVRRFGGHGIAIEGIEDGVNVLAEPNEFGKSTVFDAIHALFFHSHKGKPKPVQLLQPYSKGAVTVEVEIETPEGHFCLRKRWYGSSEARVTDAKQQRIVAQADEADRWIDACMHGGATGPAGLLWVQQGVVEMGRGTGKTTEAEKVAREDVLTSVSGEIETLTGGRRTSSVLAKCSAELEKYVTATGRPKAGGRYAQALDDSVALAASVEDMTQRVATLRGDLDRRSSAAKRLGELQDDDAIARDEATLRQADTALKAAEDQVGRLEKATLMETLARQERDAAREALSAFDTRAETIDTLTKRLAVEAEQYREADTSRTNAVTSLENSAKEVARARAALDAAEMVLNAARSAEVARATTARLLDLRNRLEEAERADRLVQTERAASAALAVGERALAKLSQLEDAIAGLTAEKRASSASVIVAYGESPSGTIRHGGETVQSGAAMSIDESAVFDIEGIGTLTVSPGSGNRTVGIDDKLRAAQEGRAAILRDLDVPSYAAALRRSEACAEHARAAERHETRRDTLAPDGLDALRIEIARLQVDAAETPQPDESIESLSERRDAAARQNTKADIEKTAAQSTFNERDRIVVELETNLRRTREALSRETEAMDGQGSSAEARIELVDRLGTLTEAFEKAHAAAATLRENVPDVENLAAIRNRAESVLARTKSEIDSLGRTISELNGSIGARAEEGIEETLSATQGRLERANRLVAQIETEVATLTRLREVLSEAKADAKEHFFEPVVKELKPLLEIVFGNATVTFDETTLLPVSLDREGAIENFDVLSGGMREQITILTRLAFARLLARDGRPVPVILDDALIYSDDERIERMFDALHRQATDLQILVFTCRQRAFHRLGGRGLSMTEWSP